MVGATLLPSMRVKAFYPLLGVITMPRPLGVDFLLIKLLNPIKTNCVDYHDMQCPKCNNVLRFFLSAFNLVNAATTITCPYCSFGTKILLGVASLLVSKLLDHGFDKSIALATNGGFEINKIGPTTIWNKDINIKQ
jgi:DNA-directed RNA polymerase subunit RPC12/RpoP